MTRRMFCGATRTSLRLAEVVGGEVADAPSGTRTHSLRRVDGNFEPATAELESLARENQSRHGRPTSEG